MARVLSPEQKTIFFGATLFFDIIFFDQLTKWLMIDARYIPIWEPWLSLTYAENKGIAFSLPLEGTPQQLVTVLLIVLLIIVMVRYKTWQRRWLHISLVLVIGGAIGNAIDRLWRGYVIDFLQVGSFPVFNIADSCVTLGVAGILIYEIIIKPRLSAQQATNPQSHIQP